MKQNENYTAEQLADAEQLAKILSGIPEEKKTIFVTIANSFAAGMEAQRAIDEAAQTAAVL